MTWVLSTTGYVCIETAVQAVVREVVSGSGDWYISLRANPNVGYVNLPTIFASEADGMEALRRMVNGVTLGDLTA